jgi:NAD(P)-dependent dehydrogenase (short-subunit alcohol dehydrogenase family)
LNEGAQVKRIVVTGASSGIGERCARLLASKGHKVFAGVRSREDAARLSSSSSSVIPMIIDVTDEASVSSAVDTISAQLSPGTGLDGLVNNAGSTVIGPVETVPLAMLRDQFEVNLIGQVRVIQAFAPLLRKGKGRIVNMGSLTAHVPFPLASPYAASKAAVRAMTHSLRLEMKPFGVLVFLIEPGNVKTNIWDKHLHSVEEVRHEMTEEQRALYSDQLESDIRMVERLKRDGIPPEQVARAVEHALTSEAPRSWYPVGTDAKVVSRAAGVLPNSVRDLLVSRFFKG